MINNSNERNIIEKDSFRIEVGNGKEKFNIDEFIKGYKDAYDKGLQESDESGYSFNVRSALPVFMLPVICYDINGNECRVDVVVNTWITSKFLDKDILSNIKKSKDIDLLDISCKGLPSHNLKFINQEELEKFVIEYIKNTPELSDLLIKNYCKIQEKLLDYYQSKKKQLENLKSLGKDILQEIKAPFTENRGLISPELMTTCFNMRKSNPANIFLKIKEYEENLFKTLQIDKHREVQNIDFLMQNLRDVDTMIENMEQQKDEFKREIIMKIKEFNKEKDGILQIDSRYLFFENGNELYNRILSKSEYKDYYIGECENLEKKFNKLAKYCHPFFIDLGCGAGSKDEIIMKKYDEYKIQLVGAIFMDGSMSAIQSCYHALEKNNNSHDFRYSFSTDWIDKLMPNQKSWEGNGLHVFNNPNIPSDNETIIDNTSLSEWPTTFSMRGGTLGCFGGYKEEFLKSMGEVMKKGDIFLVSVFDKPKSQKDIEELISKYENEESEKFVINFLQKIGIPKECMKFHVEYNNGTIEIFVDIENPTGRNVELSAFGERAQIENGVRMKIHESQRFDKKDFEKMIETYNCGLEIIDIIKNPYGGPEIYVLKK